MLSFGLTESPRRFHGDAARWSITGLLGVALLTVTWGNLILTAGDVGAEALLLKDYRPQSIYRVPQTRIARARYPVIDMHSHGYAKTAEDIARWVALMDEVGIEKTMILTGRSGYEFEQIAANFKEYPERFGLWCGFDYTGYDQPGFGPAAVAALERCHAAGAIGVGELGDKGRGLFYGSVKAWGMHIDDARMDPLLQKCAELGMPVNIHVAEPKWMYEPMDETNDGLMNAYKWRLDNQEGILGHQALIDTLERAVRKHPNTTFITCHLANCSYDLSLLGKLLDRYPNLYADIAARYAEFSPIPRASAAFFEKYQDRLVYGTDMGPHRQMYRTTFRILESEDEHFYERDQFNYHWALHGLGLSEVTLRKLYRDNARQLMDRGKP